MVSSRDPFNSKVVWHPWDWYIYLHEMVVSNGKIYGSHVGKYTMDGMYGYIWMLYDGLCRYIDIYRYIRQ